MLDIVYVTKIDHLYTLKLSIIKILELYEVNSIYIVTDRKYFKFFNFNVSVKIILIDQNEVLPNMIKSDLESLELPFFPKRSGWYFQQLLKLGVSNIDSLNENYIVIDADTVFLNHISFINEKNQFVFLKATEFHEPYFENYKVLLNEEPNREFSFISQYMVFNKMIVKEFFAHIEKQFKNTSTWNWTIMNNLKGNDGSLFSEYETYGHYIKNHYPEKCVFITKKWLRDGSVYLKTTSPSLNDVNKFSEEYCLVSFELKSSGYLNKLRKTFFHKFYPYYNYLFN
ncbi:DUF6492 family protein [Flavobacterium sp. LS1R47]|uniref:DUF6492 family protein n=1 Tax=Flavobacterium frigoritolerans TaxID=2987686 RepID=A0A9X3C8H1_9FLAO|nr:DUF6492 family protein [Flavobacterium frigoritolerans]MCV9931273.1 DUF6492 family protein [Flavobacterium frigoritolerans]